MHPNTDTHDFEFKVKHAMNFLDEGNKVKVVVMFKGREMAYTDLGKTLIEKFIEHTVEFAKVEGEVKMEGRNMSAILIPSKVKAKKLK